MKGLNYKSAAMAKDNGDMMEKIGTGLHLEKLKLGSMALALALLSPNMVAAQSGWGNSGGPANTGLPLGYPQQLPPGSQVYDGHISLPAVYGRGRNQPNWQPNVEYPGSPPPESSPQQYPYPQNNYATQASQPSPFAPAGTILPVNLMTAISMKAARKGTQIKASVNRNVSLPAGGSFIPAGSVVSGMMTDQTSGHIRRSDDLTIVFDKLTLPDGRSFPIQGQFMGGQGTNMGDPNAANRENMTRSGAGAELGTGFLATGALASMPLSHSNVTSGLYSGTSLMGAFSVLGNMMMNKRNMHDLIYPVGANMQIQLTQNLTIPSPSAPGNPQAANAPIQGAEQTVDGRASSGFEAMPQAPSSGF